MRRLVVGGCLALIAFGGALWLLQRPSREPAASATTHPERKRTVPRASIAEDVRRQARPTAKAPPGLRLGKERGPDARVKAQAILDDSLAELRRLDDTHRELARDVYMRGHSAAERVEDELDDDDEPGLAALRADEDAMKAELRRIYDATESP